MQGQGDITIVPCRMFPPVLHFRRAFCLFSKTLAFLHKVCYNIYICNFEQNGWIDYES